MDGGNFGVLLNFVWVGLKLVCRWCMVWVRLLDVGIVMLVVDGVGCCLCRVLVICCDDFLSCSRWFCYVWCMVLSSWLNDGICGCGVVG